MKKWLVRILVASLILVLLAAACAFYQLRSRGFMRAPVYETEPPALPALPRPAVLVFSKTNSFIHKEAIPAAEAMFQSLGEKNGWSVFVTENGAVHNPEDLARFDTIIWNNVTGDVLLPEQQEAMIDYVESGGGWIGIHGAGDSSSDWDWYENTLVGAQFIGHPFRPQFQEATILIERPDDLIVDHLGNEWVRTDEWYSFAESPRQAGKIVLAALDESTYSLIDHKGDDLSMGEDHPIIWKDCIHQGRTVYTALGHTAESFSEPEHVELLEDAVRWSAGLVGRHCSAGE